MMARAKNPRETTADQLRFARHYAADGGSRRAAIAIGASEIEAADTAARLMRSRVVRAEVQRLHAIRDRGLGPKPTPPAARDTEELAKNLSREYVITGLMENVEKALGRKPTLYSKVSINALGEVEIETEERYEVDPKAAEEALRILYPQMEKLEAKAKEDTQRKADWKETVAAFGRAARKPPADDDIV